MFARLKKKVLTKLSRYVGKKEEMPGISSFLPTHPFTILIFSTTIDISKQPKIHIIEQYRSTLKQLSYSEYITWLEKQKIPYRLEGRLDNIPSTVNFYNDLPVLFYDIQISFYLVFAAKQQQMFFELVWKGTYNDICK
jgi:hypothetical protein